LALVAGLTEMSVTPTEPLRNIATEFTFNFYKVSTMFCTVLNTSSHCLS
jgi:hypothetical protein